MNIDTGRVIRKLDEYLGRNDYVSAERLLNYWLAEAENESDKRGMLTVTNELIGLYRKTGREKEALTASENALELARELKLDGTVTMGTALVNAATAYKAFGQAEKALPLYE
ncbi:MAG: tetratricopeptide repeat protein, partial [Clostridia bacterium]|nr:tetratricopeptide repeat protein [Clostridia bacterium]